MDSDNYKQGQTLRPYANLKGNESNEMQRSHINTQNKWTYHIEERKKEVAQMLAQDHTETEIAQLLQVHVSTISRDVKVLKELSQRFVFDLAKGDLTYYYKQMY
jgi:DNA-binding NarL/FixJ family response regulator